MAFSLAGLLMVVALLAPNLFMATSRPRDDAERRPGKEPVVLTVLERVGQVGCIGLTVMAGSDLGDGLIGPWGVAVGVCVTANLGVWLRYLAGGRDDRLLLAPLGPVPIPMAVFPVLAFSFAALAAASVWLGIAALLLAVGHLGNTWRKAVRTSR